MNDPLESRTKVTRKKAISSWMNRPPQRGQVDFLLKRGVSESIHDFNKKFIFLKFYHPR